MGAVASADGHHHHGHGGHGHSHAPKDFGTAFLIGMVLNTGFLLAEAVFGVLANSTALLADAGHNLGDVLGLGLAWMAAVLARRLPSARFSYGLRSSSILAALVNGMILLAATGAIGLEAVQRFFAPTPVAETTVVIVAAVGIAINGATALLFARGAAHDLNLRGAFLHMAADAAVSAGVVVAALAIGATGWLWLDPVTSLAICGVIVASTWRLLSESLKMSMAAVPAGIDPGRVRAHLLAQPGVASVHDLHIWPISTAETALTCHLVMPEPPQGDAFLQGLTDSLAHDFGIDHPTIQIECGDERGCPLAPDDVV